MSAAGLGLGAPFTREGSDCTTGKTLPAYGGSCYLWTREALPVALGRISEGHGSDTATFVAMQLEYAWTPGTW